MSQKRTHTRTRVGEKMKPALIINKDNFVKEFYLFDNGDELEKAFAKTCEDFGVDSCDRDFENGYIEFEDGTTVCMTWSVQLDDACHFRLSNEDVSACGVEQPKYSAYDGRDVDCVRCQKTNKWKTYMGK